MTAVLWFRRDLRLADHPALDATAGRVAVVPLFVLDPALLGPAGGPRIAFLYRCLRARRVDGRPFGGAHGRSGRCRAPGGAGG